MTVEGRSVVVTGAGGRIGSQLTRRLATDGWSVVAMDQDGGRLGGLRELPRVTTLAGDITLDHDLDAALEAAVAAAPLGAWVNNAMVPALGRLDELTRAELEHGLAINLTAAMCGAQRAVRAFLASGSPGAIVNISSVHASVAYPGYAIYDAAKGGLEAFTRYLCVEYGHRGIRSNAIAPGAVVTDDLEQDGRPGGVAALEEMRAFSPMRALIPASRIAAAVAYLLSDDASEICGQVLTIDGGLRASAYPFPPDPSIPSGPDAWTVRGSNPDEETAT